MTVKELIKELQKCNQEKEVIVNNHGKSLDFKVSELPLKDVIYIDIK